MDIQIITPPVADMDDYLESALVRLTEAICAATGDESGYGLGGRFGYGENHENDVFVMRRFYWGDCDCGWVELEAEWSDSHDHSEDCYQNELDREKLAAGWVRSEYGWLDAPKGLSYDDARRIEDDIYKRLCGKYGLSYPNGCAVHCTCDYEQEWKALLEKHGGHNDTCSLELPNFHHKASGLKVRWYKWIGRDMEIEGAEGVDFATVFGECHRSLNAG